MTILFPEVFGHLRNGVDADAVKFVSLDDFLNPVLKISTHVAVGLIEVGKSSESAVFNTVLVVPVDVTVIVIVLGMVQRVNF